MSHARTTSTPALSASRREPGATPFSLTTHVVVSFNGVMRRLGTPNAAAIARSPFGRMPGRQSVVGRPLARGKTAWFTSRLYSARLRRWAAAAQHREA